MKTFDLYFDNIEGKIRAENQTKNDNRLIDYDRMKEEYYDLFQFDGDGNLPTEEEIKEKISDIVIDFWEGFWSKKNMTNIMVSFVLRAMLCVYKNVVKEEEETC